jgi:hypothetical protein
MNIKIDTYESGIIYTNKHMLITRYIGMFMCVYTPLVESLAAGIENITISIA